MKMKKITDRQISRITMITAIASAAVFILALIMNGVMDSRHYNRVSNYQDQREKAFLEITNYLEYNGLDDTARAMMDAFSAQYTSYSNFIITDAQYNILYNLNKGFISEESEKFFVLLNEEQSRQQALICDADGNLISSHYLESGHIDALRGLTNAYPIRANIADDSLLDEAPNAYSFTHGGSNVVISYSEQSNYDSSEFTLRFNAIKSKNLYISFLYDSDDYEWGNAYNHPNDAGRKLRENILAATMVLSFMLYWLSLPLFVFLDAKRHDNHPALWGVLALFTNVVGLIVYLVVRPERIYCTNCKEPLDRAHAYCPLCGTRNRAKCQGCGQLVQSDWSFCPACGKALASPEA